MIEYVQGNVLQADVEALVNTVNCVGHMGRGIALQFKRAFPANYEAYRTVCKRGEMAPGKVFVFETEHVTNPRYVINFPTKRHWRGKSRMTDIEAGLEDLAKQVRARGIHSVAVPPLGCGLGGLDWNEVRPRIESALSALDDVRVLVFEPSGAPKEGKGAKADEAPKMTEGRAVLVGLMERYLAGLMDPGVSLLEVHKLMYFAQEAGEPLRLRYDKGHYGPYANNLRHVLSRIEGYFVTGYGDGGDEPDKELQLVPGAVEEARAQLERHPETLRRFERVADLLEGFESPFGMELLATVHWVARREHAEGTEAIVEGVHGWGAHKQMMTDRQIRLAADRLRTRGWLDEQGNELRTGA